MLALMPPSSTRPDIHPLKGSRMSLAILPPAPMAYGQSALLESIPSPSKRPKLSLNTSNVAPIFGKGSTSLRLETLSATSPTVRNTFRNRQESKRMPDTRPNKLALTPLATNNVTPVVTELPTPSHVELPDSADTVDSTASSAASTTSDTTTDSTSSELPYKLPFNTTSILTNGPISRLRSRTMLFAQSKPMFPALKKVAFRAQLTEDIKTSKYVMKHSDIDTSSSTISTLEVTPPEQSQEVDEIGTRQEPEQPTVEEATVKPLHIDATPRPMEQDGDGDSCPATPVAGRRKRDRQWVWTLGPVAPTSQDGQSEDAGIGEEETEVT